MKLFMTQPRSINAFPHFLPEKVRGASVLKFWLNMNLPREKNITCLVLKFGLSQNGYQYICDHAMYYIAAILQSRSE
jgi:hypothetical protein